MHAHNKYPSLFKSNRSQASLLSNQSNQSVLERGSFQPSPVDSPLHSPAFPKTLSSTSSPLSPNDRERDDSLTVATASYSQAAGVPRRSQSQRSSPSSQLSNFGPILAGPTPGSPRIDEDKPDYQQQQNPTSAPKPEAKKKRRFFGLVESSSTKEAAPTTKLTKSISPKGFGRSSSISHWPSGSTSAKFPPSVVAEDQADSPNTKNSFRHSIATPPIRVEESPQSPPSGPQLYHPNSPQQQTYPTVSIGQHSDETPPRSPTWERFGGRTPVPNHSFPADQSAHYDQQLSLQDTHNLGYPRTSSSSSRPPSRQSLEPPSPSFSQHREGEIQFHQRSSSLQASPAFVEPSMGPPSQPHSSGRSVDITNLNTGQGQNREGAGYQPYGQAPQGGAQPPTGQYGSQLSVNNTQNNNNYRTPQASPMAQQNSNSEQGRNTPPPSRSRDDLASLDIPSLLSRHEELNDKYRKVKKYYFDKDAQVQQLQNTLAHQRLAQSRTSLDDNEYATRFNRLDGAINNLAFNIRKDWRAVPPWLAPYVNRDATSLVTKEMTAVGRACISRWLVDEILDRYFHPALEPNLSSQLKIIEKNLRRYAPPTPTEEEKEALLAKISNWRLATLDGLQDNLSGMEAAEYRASLTDILVKMLTADLMMNLKEPPPVGLDAGVVGIIELTVGIAANLPLESRDVYVDYIMPGVLVNENYMKVEGALPALTNPGEGLLDPERTSMDSMGEKDEADRDSLKDFPAAQKKKGMFGTFMGKKVATNTPPSSRGANLDAQPIPLKEERVRFAAFMSVEVRGKNMLVKAPVYV